jgi:hypothetical protein
MGGGVVMVGVEFVLDILNTHLFDVFRKARVLVTLARFALG